ncbi:MAG: hypothetical protein ACW986_08160 [Promethearchaeota archaeon]|jgi:hypothetical protein
MAKIKFVVIALIFFSLIGIIHAAIQNSFIIFISWLLIGIWLIYSFKVLKNIKQYREFNSPHNTAFFTIGPAFMGIFYSIWGNFTEVLGNNLLEDSSIYISWWSILFGLPYVLYGSISLYRCFKKYNVIYFGTKSIKARKFGFILGVSIILYIIIYWASFYLLVNLVDLNLLIMLISTILILIVPGFFSSRTQLPQLTREYIAQRTNRLNQLTSPSRNVSPRRRTIRNSTRSSLTPSTRTVSHSSRSVSNSTRSTPNGHIQSRNTRVKTSTRTTTRNTTVKPIRRSQSTSKQVNNKIYRPKAANLSIEDFKCIFCFKLPESPKDNGRGIILCPNCRYPAHADEFKDWLRTSGLCSRCNAQIPSSYKRNPKIISVKTYSIAYKGFLKKR